MYTHRLVSCPTMDALQKAIDFFGSQAALANALGVSPMAVTQWKTRGIPPSRCLDIEMATKKRVTRHDLRPDLFGHPGVAA